MGPIGNSTPHTYLREPRAELEKGNHPNMVITKSAPRFRCILWGHHAQRGNAVGIHLAKEKTQVLKPMHHDINGAFLLLPCNLHSPNHLFSDMLGNFDGPNTRMAADGHLLIIKLAIWGSQSHIVVAKGMLTISA